MLASKVWSSWFSPDIPLGRMLLVGAIICAAYSLLYLTRNGLIVDELVMQARVVAGEVSYPSDHPHEVYYKQAYNLPGYISAAILKIGMGASAISASRNFIFLFLSIYLPFVFTVALTRNLIWGLLASALVLTETLIYFNGTYPLRVFPQFYSHGHIGMHVGLLVAAFLLGGFWRWGGSLLGLLPALHPTMAIIIWPWSGLYLLLRWRSLERTQRVHLITSFALGLAVSIGFALFVFVRASDASISLSNDLHLYGQNIYEKFTSNFDVHRRPFEFRSFGYLLNPVIYFALGLFLLWIMNRDSNGHTPFARRMILMLLLLGVMTWAYVYSFRAILFFNGSLPELVNISMPFRFSNFTALLLIPLTISALYYVQRNQTVVNRSLSVLLLTLLFVAGAVYFLLEDRTSFIIVRALGRGLEPIWLMFTVWGVLLASAVFADLAENKKRLVSLVTAAILCVFLLLVFRGAGQAFAISFVASCVVYLAGVIWKNRLARLALPAEMSWARPALISVLLLTSFVALFHTKIWDNRIAWQSGNDLGIRFDTISQYDRDIQNWFELNAEPDEIILVPLCCVKTGLQAKIHQPVLLDQDTLYMMSYKPNLAGPIGHMAKDLFEIDFSSRNQLSTSWQEVWKTRQADEWMSLGEKYDFRIIVSPKDLQLDLPIEFQGPLWTLYTIPRNRDELLSRDSL